MALPYEEPLHDNDPGATRLATAVAAPSKDSIDLIFADDYEAYVDDPRRVDRLGKGGQGDVSLTHTIDPFGNVGDRHALKRVTKGTLSARRLAREGTVMLDLEDRFLRRGEIPAIPRALEYTEDDQCAYLMMDHIPGRSLKDVGAAGVDVPTALNYADQLLHILDVMHTPVPADAQGRFGNRPRNEIVHNDVSPQNIIIWRERVILCDFGTALEGGEIDPQPNGQWGKMRWMSPEQLLRGVKNDVRADIFGAAGTILNTLSGGRYDQLRDGATPIAIGYVTTSRQYLDIVYRVLDELPPDVPDAVKDVIWKAMAFEPEERYQSAREMQLALKQAISVAPTARLIAIHSLSRLRGSRR